MGRFDPPGHGIDKSGRAAGASDPIETPGRADRVSGVRPGDIVREPQAGFMDCPCMFPLRAKAVLQEAPATSGPSAMPGL